MFTLTVHLASANCIWHRVGSSSIASAHCRPTSLPAEVTIGHIAERAAIDGAAFALRIGEVKDTVKLSSSGGQTYHSAQDPYHGPRLPHVERWEQPLSWLFMSAETPPAQELHLIVGFDGSPAAMRSLDAAVRLLAVRPPARITVIWVAHLTSTVELSADAVAIVENDFDQV
ncbi:MAG: hypothetical protein ACRDOB_03880, partial [Streptosporangiaceae bacterium]